MSERSAAAATHWQARLDEGIERRYDQLVAIRRHLHVYPEPSGCEQQTSAFLSGRLSEFGFPTRLGPDGRGVIADWPIEETDGAACLALRADIDALRIEDRKQVGYTSQVRGVMHACGHDAHAAVVVGALAALRDAAGAGDLPWPVRLRGVFQPAEETNVGAAEMISVGALAGVGAILAVHVDPSLPCGQVGVREGALTAACDSLNVRIQGRGGHAARPHESIDPIAAAAQLISSIYLFVPRAVESHDPVVVTIGQITGGDNSNVIPEEVQLRGTVRTLGGAVRHRTKEHIRQLARGLAEASGTRIQVDFCDGPQSVHNDRRLTSLVRRTGRELLGADGVREIARPSMGGEDFALYLETVPGCMFRLGCAPSADGGPPLHSPLFDVDERAIAVGAKMLARAAVAWFDPSRTEKGTPS